MQGTVHRYDAASQSGSLLLDDGSELRFDAAAFARSGLRLLRSGQRVQIRVDPAGAVVGLALVTMPQPRR